MSKWPENMREWYRYVQSLSGSTLTDKARAVNGLKFVEMLQEEGYSSQDIEDILYWFAARLDADETSFVPTGSSSYISYQRLLEIGEGK